VQKARLLATFDDQGTADIYHGRDTKPARRTLSKTLWPRARRLLDQLDEVDNVSLLATPLSNRLELLKGDRKGFWSVRINDQYRIVFRWQAKAAHHVHITDYH
jgi:proteic killer suppression protein